MREICNQNKTVKELCAEIEQTTPPYIDVYQKNNTTELKVLSNDMIPSEDVLLTVQCLSDGSKFYVCGKNDTEKDINEHFSTFDAVIDWFSMI